MKLLCFNYPNCIICLKITVHKTSLNCVVSLMNIEKLNLVGGMPIHQLIVTNQVTSDHAKYS